MAGASIVKTGPPRKTPSGMMEDLNEHLLASGRKVVQVAQQLAPIRTGNLRQSIRFNFNPSTHTLEFIVGAPYGLFVEYGTYKMAPRPFLRPAFMLNGPSFSAGANADFQFMSTLPVDYKPRKILPHIRPVIAAQNARLHNHNVRKAALTIRHVDKQGGILTHKSPNDLIFTKKSSITKVHRSRKAWN